VNHLATLPLGAVAAVWILGAGCSRDAATSAASAAKPYPLTVCVVSGEKLGSMGEPHVFGHEGQQIKLCCDGCLKDFKKDAANHRKKLAAAAPAVK
jgi:hypothetical protein